MSKRNVSEGTLFSAQPMSGGFTTVNLDPEDYLTLSLTLSWAGADASNSTFLIEVCDVNGNWNSTPSNSTVTINSSETVQILKYQYVNFKYLRMTYTPNSVTTGLISCTYRLYNERD